MAESSAFWVKLVRATQHLDELKGVIEPFAEPRPYAVRKSFDPKSNQWTYTAHVEDPVDPMLPAILGDFLFDVRSALDHAAVAFAPNRRKGKASFPIITLDIDKPTLNRAETEARLHWLYATEGVPADALAVIKWAQPYMAAVEEGEDPENHVLALLGSFQNADKHRELTVVAQGLAPSRLFITLPDGTRTVEDCPRLPDGQLLSDGAVIERLPVEVEMEIEGAVQIAIARRQDGPHRPIPHFCDLLLDFVGTHVLAPLEKLRS